MSDTDIFDIALYHNSISDLSKRRQAEEVLQDLKLAMNAELAKYDSFSDKLVIITDTLENISNLINGRKLVSYEEFRKSRKLLAKRKVKIFRKKGFKKLKKWKN